MKHRAITIFLVMAIIAGGLSIWKFGGGDDATKFYNDMAENEGIYYTGTTLVTQEQYQTINSDLLDYPVGYTFNITDVADDNVVLVYSFLSVDDYPYLDSEPIPLSVNIARTVIPAIVVVFIILFALSVAMKREGVKDDGH